MKDKYTRNYIYVNLDEICMKNSMGEEVNLKRLAKKFGIDEEYQKIVLVNNRKYNLGCYNLYELVSGHPFNFYQSHFIVSRKNTEDGKPKVLGIPSWAHGHYDSSLIVNVKVDYVTSDEVLKFYNELIENNKFETYKRLMCKIFGYDWINYAPSLDERLVELVKGDNPMRYNSAILSKIDNKRREKIKSKIKK